MSEKKDFMDETMNENMPEQAEKIASEAADKAENTTKRKKKKSSSEKAAETAKEEASTPVEGGEPAETAEQPEEAAEAAEEKPAALAAIGGFFAKMKEKASEKAEELKAKKAEKASEKAAAAEAEEESLGETEEYEEYEAEEEEYEEDKTWVVRRNTTHGFGCLGGILYFLFIACISIVLGSLLWMFASDMLGMEMESGESVQIVVPEDFTVDEVTEMLYEKGVVSYKFLFKFYADLSGAEEKIAPGVYEINTESDYRSVVNDMRANKGARDVAKVTIPEGWTMYQIFEKLEEEGVCTAEELWDAATNYPFQKDFIILELGNKHRLEGFLFPDTYQFYMGDTPENVISKFLDNFAVKWSVEYTARGNELGYDLEEILAIASIIEKEAGRATEMGPVSSVIHNRLKANMTLGMESTLAYIVQGTDKKPVEALNIDDPYNTTMYKGLPAGPISNPGIEAIYAALYPESTNYYYFALGKDGLTHFFNNYNQFLAFRNSAEYGGE